MPGGSLVESSPLATMGLAPQGGTPRSERVRAVAGPGTVPHACLLAWARTCAPPSPYATPHVPVEGELSDRPWEGPCLAVSSGALTPSSLLSGVQCDGRAGPAGDRHQRPPAPAQAAPGCTLPAQGDCHHLPSSTRTAPALLPGPSWPPLCCRLRVLGPLESPQGSRNSECLLG